MLAVRNGQPQHLAPDSDRRASGPDPTTEVPSGSTLPGRSGTRVGEETTTRVRAARGAHLGIVVEPAGPPRRAGAPRPLAAGHRLGPYRLLEQLGRGAQGDVWKALRLGPCAELVALKVLRPALSRNPARMAQFRREAERGLRLVDPALLPVYELHAIDGHHFMTMPCVEGITLREVIKGRQARLRGGPSEPIHHLVTLDEPDYLRAMTRVLARAAHALGRVHDHRIAHRDIKPANILLERQRPDGVYLCDFGLGRDLEVATAEQMRDGAGTPMYMAPERLLRAPADEIKCDIYSMGVTLFEALTLERPFQVPEHVTASSLPAYLVRTGPRRPGAVRPDFPPEHEAVILKAMARDPARRYESADHLAAALDELVARGAPLGIGARGRRSAVRRAGKGGAPASISTDR